MEFYFSDVIWRILAIFGRVIFSVLWHSLVLLLFILRKCILLVSLLQLYSHCSTVIRFWLADWKKANPKQRYHHQTINNNAYTVETEFHELESLKQEENYYDISSRQVPKPGGRDIRPFQGPNDRKMSRTLLAVRHQKNYASMKDYWSGKPIEDSSKRQRFDFESGQSSQRDFMGNSLEGKKHSSRSSNIRGIYVDDVHHRVHDVHEVLDVQLEESSAYYSSNKSSDDYVLVNDESAVSSSSEEFIKAFLESDVRGSTRSSEDEADDVIQVNIVSSDDCVDYSRTTEDFVRIAESSNFAQVLELFSVFIEKIGIYPGHINDFFPAFREFVLREVPFRFDDLLDKLEYRRHLPEYKGGNIGRGKKVLIIGGGPCGLRLAMETQLLGAETTVIESRDTIDRNNILKLWSFVMEDLKNMGAKKLCPSLGIGCLNHVSIKTLQFVLLKICLMLGVRVKPRQSFKAILEPSISSSWPVISDVYCENGDIIEEEEEFDVVIGATGRRVTLDGFERQSLDAKMAIAITANFRNFNTVEEKHVEEIPGLSKQYDMRFFRDLEETRGIKLENIVYYQGKTHYFVMTAKKESLLKKGVIIMDLGERGELLRPENIDKHKLEIYAREAAEFSTAHFSHQLPNNPFAKWKGENDVSIFDFTNLYRSQNACRIIERNGCTLLTGLVGDSLLEPFWPEGTGIGQGFLGVLDTAWMIRRYFENTKVYEVIREREKLYCLLRQTSQGGLKKNFEKWSIDPRTRYNTTTFHFNQGKIFQLFDTDNPSSDDTVDMKQVSETVDVRVRKRTKKATDLNHTRETMFFAD